MAYIEIENIVLADELLDMQINLAQRVLKLKQRFSELNGLESILYQNKQQFLSENDVKNKLQIIHCEQRHHWILPVLQMLLVAQMILSL